MWYICATGSYGTVNAQTFVGPIKTQVQRFLRKPRNSLKCCNFQTLVLHLGRVVGQIWSTDLVHNLNGGVIFLTCLLNCIIPRVGKTHALAGGMISASAKLTHCSTWAAAWGLAPRRASLLTGRRTEKCSWESHLAGNIVFCQSILVPILKLTRLCHLGALNHFSLLLKVTNGEGVILTIVSNGITLKQTEAVISLERWNLG